jgi:hypothetical protein
MTFKNYNYHITNSSKTIGHSIGHTKRINSSPYLITENSNRNYDSLDQNQKFVPAVEEETESESGNKQYTLNKARGKKNVIQDISHIFEDK